MLSQYLLKTKIVMNYSVRKTSLFYNYLRQKNYAREARTTDSSSLPGTFVPFLSPESTGLIVNLYYNAACIPSQFSNSTFTYLAQM